MIIAPCKKWTPEVEAMITSALTTATLDDVKAQVEQGAALFVVQDDDAETVCAFVLRIDRFATYDEGVVVAAGGNAPGVDLTAVVMPWIEKRFTGCKSLRIHTERVGLVKKLVRQGYTGVEYVVKKELNNGRQQQ